MAFFTSGTNAAATLRDLILVRSNLGITSTQPASSPQGIGFRWQMEVDQVLVGANVEKANVDMSSSFECYFVKVKSKNNRATWIKYNYHETMVND